LRPIRPFACLLFTCCPRFVADLPRACPFVFLTLQFHTSNSLTKSFRNRFAQIIVKKVTTTGEVLLSVVSEDLDPEYSQG
jgi:hypothetical protein